jgi:hypothetical protein
MMCARMAMCILAHTVLANSQDNGDVTQTSFSSSADMAATAMFQSHAQKMIVQTSQSPPQHLPRQDSSLGSHADSTISMLNGLDQDIEGKMEPAGVKSPCKQLQ